MGFGRGEVVEVASKEEGFVGSYYAAIVITDLPQKEYIVVYRNLMKDDLSEPLREIVSADVVRPVPPEIRASGFFKDDKVDAYDNDGWWVGKITRKIGSVYFVYFETTGEEIAYPRSRLRVHHDWLNGNWFSSNNRGPSG